MKKIIFMMSLIPFLLMCNSRSEAEENQNIYSGVDPEKYVSGEFIPEKERSFVSLERVSVNVNRGPQYLRIEAANALHDMMRVFEKEHRAQRLKLVVLSSTRNFDVQTNIWNAKWGGLRKVDGMNLKTDLKNPKDRAIKILRYSSMPGTSRHHWGTDFDLNSLNPEYFNNGNGKIIYDWLVKNAKRFGFGQPFNANRTGGYAEEKWHWSYLPLSKIFYADWVKFYEKDKYFFLKHNNFEGSDVAKDLSFEYVTDVNAECK